MTICYQLFDVQLWSNSHRREDVIPALRNSLAALQLDYVDMYLMHFPIAVKVRGNQRRNRPDVHSAHVTHTELDRPVLSYIEYLV